MNEWCEKLSDAILRRYRETAYERRREGAKGDAKLPEEREIFGGRKRCERLMRQDARWAPGVWTVGVVGVCPAEGVGGVADVRRRERA